MLVNFIGGYLIAEIAGYCMEVNLQIGYKIKALRIKYNYTQEELATKCGLSKGFISLLERDLTSPSIATLIIILDSLGTNLKEFFSNKLSEKVIFSTKGIQPIKNEQLKNEIIKIFNDNEKRILRGELINIKSGGSTEDYPAHDGYEYGYVIKGKINVYYGNIEYKARKGDIVLFKAKEPFTIKNNENNLATVLWTSIFTES